MRKGPLLAIGLALGCAGSLGDPEEPRQVAHQGEELYHRYCGACHGRSADGAGPMAMLLDPRPADLTRIAARNGGAFPQAAVLRTIDGRDPVIVSPASDRAVLWSPRDPEVDKKSVKNSGPRASLHSRPAATGAARRSGSGT